MDKTYGISDTIVPVRLTGTGLVYNGACKLHWISCNPSAGNSVWALTDAIAAGGAILLDHFYTGKEGHLDILLPPCPFATGIYLETFTNMTSVTFGYSVV